MTFNDIYGSDSHTAEELAGLIAVALDVTFVERDSYFRGCYFVAEALSGRIEVQPNAIPGDDGVDDFYDLEHPEITTMVLVTGDGRDRAVLQRLLLWRAITWQGQGHR